jgi:hypothetical protein
MEEKLISVVEFRSKESRKFLKNGARCVGQGLSFCQYHRWQNHCLRAGAVAAKYECRFLAASL